MYLMTILTTKRNGFNMIEVEDILIDSFKWDIKDDKKVFKYSNKCMWEELKHDEYNEEYLIGLRED